jgi:uncharacterized membrane protein (DUF441 family)
MAASGRLGLKRLIEAYSTPIALSAILTAVVVATWLSGDAVIAQTVTDTLIRVMLVVGL